jgi:hypothetical protein
MQDNHCLIAGESAWRSMIPIPIGQQYHFLDSRENLVG